MDAFIIAQVDPALRSQQKLEEAAARKAETLQCKLIATAETDRRHQLAAVEETNNMNHWRQAEDWIEKVKIK